MSLDIALRVLRSFYAGSRVDKPVEFYPPTAMLVLMIDSPFSYPPNLRYHRGLEGRLGIPCWVAFMNQYAARFSVSALVLVGIVCLVQAHRGFSTLAGGTALLGGSVEIKDLKQTQLTERSDRRGNSAHVNGVVQRHDGGLRPVRLVKTVSIASTNVDKRVTSNSESRIRGAIPNTLLMQIAPKYLSPYRNYRRTQAGGYISTPRYHDSAIPNPSATIAWRASMQRGVYSPIPHRKPRRRMCFFGPGEG